MAPSPSHPTGLHSVAILVPVLDRPARVAPLVESVRATTGSRLLFVVSPNDRDQLVECNRSGENVLVVGWEPGRGDYARKINAAYRETTEEFLFCGADDLAFRPGWEQNALQVADRSNAGVIGTQDLGNPLVKRGRHTTHPLIRREYIENGGGTFDNTGEIYCELYDHQYIDLECVEVARARGRWAFAKNSVVEHLHVNWGKAPQDNTYAKAFRHVREDRALYQRRMRTFQQLCRRQRATL